MPNISVSFTTEQLDSIRDAAAARGFGSKNEYIRHAVMAELALPDMRFTLAAIYETLCANLKAVLLRTEEPEPAGKAQRKEEAARTYSEIIARVAAKLNQNAANRPTNKGARETISNIASAPGNRPRQGTLLEQPEPEEADESGNPRTSAAG